MASQQLTQESLLEWFDYDGKTLSWKDKNRETKICLNRGGYPMIRFAKNARLVHRLVFLMVHGYISKELDHKNGIKTDYSIDNLRTCTRSENTQNRGAEKCNTSGYKGVSWDIRNKRWQARAAKNGKTYSQVGFKDAEDADEYVCLLRDLLHGNFANHRGVQ